MPRISLPYAELLICLALYFVICIAVYVCGKDNFPYRPYRPYIDSEEEFISILDTADDHVSN